MRLHAALCFLYIVGNATLFPTSGIQIQKCVCCPRIVVTRLTYAAGVKYIPTGVQTKLLSRGRN